MSNFDWITDVYFTQHNELYYITYINGIIIHIVNNNYNTNLRPTYQIHTWY